MTVSAPQAKPKLLVSRPLRMLAALGAFVLIFGALLGSTTISSLHGILAHCTEKDYIKQTLVGMGFSEGVPSDFAGNMALRLPPAVSIVFADKSKDMQWLAIYCYESQKDGAIDAKEQIDAFYDIGIFTGLKGARFKSVKKQDKIDLDGHGRMVQYLIGTLRDPEEIVYTGALACLVNGKKVLMVQFMQPSDKPFSLDLVLDIMRRASSF